MNDGPGRCTTRPPYSVLPLASLVRGGDADHCGWVRVESDRPSEVFDHSHVSPADLIADALVVAELTLAGLREPAELKALL